MIMTRFVLLAATGILTISLVGCEDSNQTASNKPAKKVYYAHDVTTGSHLQRAYTDPNEPTVSSSNMQTGNPGTAGNGYLGSGLGGRSGGGGGN